MKPSTVVYQKIMHLIRTTQRQERTEGPGPIRGSFYEKEVALEEIMDLVTQYGDERVRDEVFAALD